MCWCQKWFLKNKKTSLTCILASKTIWKVTATTLLNKPLRAQHHGLQDHDVRGDEKKKEN